MILQENIHKRSNVYGNYAYLFLEGANFALENPWISVEDDLPCNHEELLHARYRLATQYVVTNIRGRYYINRMLKYKGRWVWETGAPTHWFPIPKLSK